MKHLSLLTLALFLTGCGGSSPAPTNPLAGYYSAPDGSSLTVLFDDSAYGTYQNMPLKGSVRGFTLSGVCDATSISWTVKAQNVGAALGILVTGSLAGAPVSESLTKQF